MQMDEKAEKERTFRFLFATSLVSGDRREAMVFSRTTFSCFNSAICFFARDRFDRVDRRRRPRRDTSSSGGRLAEFERSCSVSGFTGGG